MPPGHHSSSHHSSSHHSSSHHSSSHRSSGPSYHSSSSHSSSSWSSGPSRHSSTSRYSAPVYRVRINQPKGYVGSGSGSKVTTLRCRRHDYVFYPVAWTDSSSGTRYERGYYDEDGKRYDAVALKKNGEYTTTFHCEYCGTEVKTAWKEGASPSCPNCGAVLNSANIIMDEESTAPLGMSGIEEVSGSQYMNRGIRKGMIVLIVYVVFIFMSGLMSCASSLIDSFTDSTKDNYSYYYDNDNGYGKYQSNKDLFGESYYVEEIERTCPYIDEYESYYDAVTDCYFWYNNEIWPYGWQYWYEDISSDYGDYGWMEYDYEDGKWYIECDENNWIVLPDKYDASALWHMNE